MDFDAPENITLAAIFSKNDWEDVEPRMIELYFNIKYKNEIEMLDITEGKKISDEEFNSRVNQVMEKFEKLFISVNRKKVGHSKANYTIRIDEIIEDMFGTGVSKPWWDIYAVTGKKQIENGLYKRIYKRKEKDGTLTEEDIKFAQSEEKYACDLCVSSAWMGMSIDKDCLEKLGEIDVICHCLWGMTFFGFEDKDIKAEKSILFNRIGSIRNGLSKSIPWEEVKKNIKERISAIHKNKEITPVV